MDQDGAGLQGPAVGPRAARLVPCEVLHAPGGGGAVVDPDPGAVRSREALAGGLRVQLGLRAGGAVPGLTAVRHLRRLSGRGGITVAFKSGSVLQVYYFTRMLLFNTLSYYQTAEDS